MRFLDHRQKRTGWMLIAIAAGYLIWFLKVRLFSAGLPIERKEWIYFCLMLVCLMLGTINVRMAMMRDRRELQQSNNTSA